VNPLIHDENVKKEVERFERARLERKIADIQKKKGISNLKQLKNLDVLLKDEELPSWNFNIEKKTYKDTINNLTNGSFDNTNNKDTRKSLSLTRDSKYIKLN
jgi:hypothetical protein